MSTTETKTATGVILAPDLATRYKLAEAQLALIPPIDEDDAEEWTGLRQHCEEVMLFIERTSAAEERERKLLASLADADTVHANILRGTIALTKAQAVHIAGLPADIEERERVLVEGDDSVLSQAHIALCWVQEKMPQFYPDMIQRIKKQCGIALDEYEARAALATPAPEQPAQPKEKQ